MTSTTLAQPTKYDIVIARNYDDTKVRMFIFDVSTTEHKSIVDIKEMESRYFPRHLQEQVDGMIPASVNGIHFVPKAFSNRLYNPEDSTGKSIYKTYDGMDTQVFACYAEFWPLAAVVKGDYSDVSSTHVDNAIIFDSLELLLEES